VVVCAAAQRGRFYLKPSQTGRYPPVARRASDRNWLNETAGHEPRQPMGFRSSLLGRWRWSASASGSGNPGGGAPERRPGLGEHDVGLGSSMGRPRVYSISGADIKPPFPGGQVPGPCGHEALRAGGGPRPAAGISATRRRRPVPRRGQRVGSVPVRRARNSAQPVSTTGGGGSPSGAPRASRHRTILSWRLRLTRSPEERILPSRLAGPAAESCGATRKCGAASCAAGSP